MTHELQLEERRLRVHRLPRNTREEVLQKLRRTLEPHAEVALAVVYGSFVKADAFRDIDIGVYLLHGLESDFSYQALLEAELEEATGLPVDLRVLNDAPPRILASILRDCVVLVDRGWYRNRLYLKALDELYHLEHGSYNEVH